jgi:O-antigen/teichoic acid export membrane protein
LNAIGKIKISLYLMVFWTIATWVLTPILIVFMGFNGVAAASALISISVVLVIYLTRKYVRFDVFKATMFPFLAAAIMGVVIYLLGPLVIKNLISLLFMIGFGAMVYFLCIFLFARNEVTADVQLVLRHLKK